MAADDELRKMERYLSGIFSQAEKDLIQKSLKYMADFQRKEKVKLKKVENGEITDDEYKEWRKNQLLYGEHWTRLIQLVQKEMVNVNQTALDYINDKTTQIYADSYNSIATVIKRSPVEGYSFELVDANTVKNLAKEEGIILPPKKRLDVQKDKLWNAKQVNAQLLQGILQGEDIPHIAGRMAKVCESNEKASIRNARTMVTAAENSGRQSGMNKAESDGIIFKKMWIATRDERTRETHMVLNGQLVANGEKFVTINGDEIEFPGDWRAEPSEVYNCRCTLGSIVTGFNKVKLEETIEQQSKEQTQEQTAEQTEETATSREELMNQTVDSILNANIDWDNAPDFMRATIVESIEKCPEHLLSVINDSMANLNSMVFVESGTSHYTFGTGDIVICINGRDANELVEVFWHEFGHYVDDAVKSGSGYGYTQYFENSRLAQDENGNIIRVVEKEEHSVNRIKSVLSIYDVYGQRYQNAVANDVNRVLKNQKLDKIFEVKPSKDEYGHQYILKNGEYYNTVNTLASDTEKLHKALVNEVNRITGRTELDNFMFKNGMPREPIRESYYKVTIKNGEATVFEKYPGARNDYENDYSEYLEKLNQFQSSEKYEQLIREQRSLRIKVGDLEEKVGHVTDTFDAGCFGLFNSTIGLGGHTPEYYVDYGLAMDEQIANVFMSEVLQDRNILELNSKLNTETYELIKEVLQNERNFK